MPRANRHFIPGLVWHITHRCHQREFLLKFAHDRDNYLYWLYDARKKFGVRVLDYMVTSSGVHLLRDPGSAYTTHFGPEKGDLGLDNTWFWDSNSDE